MTGPQPTDERALAGAVAEHHRTRPPGHLRQLDRDRTDVAVVMWRAGVCDHDIALICGVRPHEVQAVLAGKPVR